MLAAVVVRSSMIAMTTMQRPATEAPPRSPRIRPSMTGWPRPGLSMNAAIVTIDSAAIIVWLTPTMIVRLAIGSSTFRSRWSLVCPSDAVASSVVAETFLIAYAVIRVTGGRA